jgi:hypothetical protein
MKPVSIENKMAGRKRINPTSASFRSAVSNGSRIFVNVDGRSEWMRRLRDLMQDHVIDLGGEDNISEAERRLVRRAAVITLQLEFQEAHWAAEADGEAKAWQLNDYQRAANSLRRILESLGLQRRARDVMPTLEQYARGLETAE